MKAGDEIRGQCHCGRVRVRVRLSQTPETLQLRACQCSFCRRQGAVTFADPRGHAVIEAPTPDAVQRYRFALKTADYLICAECGTYIGVMLDAGGAHLATINAAGMDLPPFRGREPSPVDYSAEGFEERLRRRLAAWMPAEIAFASTKEEQAVH
jgi:hypothetical protein